MRKLLLVIAMLSCLCHSAGASAVGQPVPKGTALGQHINWVPTANGGFGAWVVDGTFTTNGTQIGIGAAPSTAARVTVAATGSTENGINLTIPTGGTGVAFNAYVPNNAGLALGFSLHGAGSPATGIDFGVQGNTYPYIGFHSQNTAIQSQIIEAATALYLDPPIAGTVYIRNGPNGSNSLAFAAGTGAITQLGATATGMLNIKPNNAAYSGESIQLVSGQTADGFDIVTSAGLGVLESTPNGSLYVGCSPSTLSGGPGPGNPVLYFPNGGGVQFGNSGSKLAENYGVNVTLPNSDDIHPFSVNNQSENIGGSVGASSHYGTGSLFVANEILSGQTTPSSTFTPTAGLILGKQFQSNGNAVNTFASGVTEYGYNTLQPLAVPAAPTVTATGTTGSVSYFYKITALSNGNETSSSAETNVTNSNATLSATNYNLVAWTAVPGAEGYNIYRSATTGTETKIATVGINITNYNDVSNTAGLGTPSNYNATGVFTTPYMTLDPQTPTVNSNGAATFVGYNGGNKSSAIIGANQIGGIILNAAKDKIAMEFNGSIVDFFSSDGSLEMDKIGSAAAVSMLDVQSISSTRSVLYLRGASGQSADFFDVLNSTGSTLAGITSTGAYNSTVPYQYNGTPGVASATANGMTISGGLVTAYNSSAAQVSGPDNVYINTAATYAVVSNVDRFVMNDATSNSIVDTLPDPSTYVGQEIDFSRSDTSGTNTVTFATAGTSKTITGATSITAQYQVRHAIPYRNGSGWFIY